MRDFIPEHPYFPVVEHRKSEDDATNWLVRAINVACLNQPAYGIGYSFWEGHGIEAYRWVLRHERHTTPLVIVLHCVPVPGHGIECQVVIALDDEPTDAVLINRPKHVATGGIVTTVLRAYGLQGTF